MLTVLIPAYNKEKVIQETIDKVRLSLLHFFN